MAQNVTHLLIVTGPESAGKTTLAGQLAGLLGAPLVPEVARDWFAQAASSNYTSADVLAIAHAQFAAEQTALANGQSPVIADTDQQVLRLWWQEKFGSPPAEMLAIGASAQPSVSRHYLLCLPDLDWEPDPLRENPHDRMRLFQLQLSQLQACGARFRVIWGKGAHRLRLARDYVDAVLGQ